MQSTDLNHSELRDDRLSVERAQPMQVLHLLRTQLDGFTIVVDRGVLGSNFLVVTSIQVSELPQQTQRLREARRTCSEAKSV